MVIVTDMIVKGEDGYKYVLRVLLNQNDDRRTI